MAFAMTQQLVVSCELGTQVLGIGNWISFSNGGAGSVHLGVMDIFNVGTGRKVVPFDVYTYKCQRRLSSLIKCSNMTERQIEG